MIFPDYTSYISQQISTLILGLYLHVSCFFPNSLVDKSIFFAKKFSVSHNMNHVHPFSMYHKSLGIGR